MIDIFVPHYYASGRRLIDGRIPPCPPIEQREKRRRALVREVPSYRGRWPSGIIAPTYNEVMRAMDGSGGMSGGMQLLNGIDTELYGSASGIPSLQDARFAYQWASNSFLDSTANANNLTGHNGPTVTAGPISGATNGALSVASGSSQYADHTYASVYNLSATDALVAIWVWIAASPNSFGKPIWKASSGNVRDWGVGFNNTGTTPSNFFSNAAGVGGGVAWGAALSTTTWHLIFTRMLLNGGGSASRAGISVNNGAFVEIQCNDGYFNATTGQLTFGRDDPSNLNYFNGKIGPAWGWARDIGSAGYALLYNSGAGAMVF